METLNASVQPVRLKDIGTITRMAYDNMNGADRVFTQLVANPLSRWASYLYMPIYFMVAGRGYKSVIDNQIAGCAYLHLRRNSGFIFNVNVNRSFRRQGIANQLMMHLESITAKSGKSWTVLQVDNENFPAQNLYQNLGYKPYNPAIFRWEGTSPISIDAENGIELDRLSPFRGRQLFNRFKTAEIQRDGLTALDVVEDYDDDRAIARNYWRCLYHDNVVGCACNSGSESRPFFRIVLDEEYWGHSLMAGLIVSLVDELKELPSRIDLAFGSSAHSAAGESVLENMNFKKRTKSRLLMFKFLVE